MWARVPVPARVREQDGAAVSVACAGHPGRGQVTPTSESSLLREPLHLCVSLRPDGDHLLTWSTQKLQRPTFPELTCGAQRAGQASSPCIPPSRNRFLGLPLHFLLRSAYLLNKPQLPMPVCWSFAPLGGCVPA